MSTTRATILEHALARFNRDGIDQVGVRDLARDLGISAGNLSYHFRRKDDLVAALAAQLTERNRAVLAEEPSDLGEFLGAYEIVFGNQATYRCLAESVVSLYVHNSVLAMAYRNAEQDRRALLEARVGALRGEGGLRPDLSDERVHVVLGHLTLLVRMWLSEARISFHSVPLEHVKRHYLRLLAEVLAAEATDDGRRMLAPWCSAALLS